MEQQQTTLEVKVISTETIKPSKPTPSDRNSYTFSSLDQNSTFNTYPILLFYPNNNSSSDDQNHQPVDVVIDALKTSLSSTLTEFYPLAGRCNDNTSISCNDQGIPFIETRVSSTLSDVLNSCYEPGLLNRLLPSIQLYMNYGQRPVSEVAHFAFQFNVLSCGGIVLGCYVLHKLLDGVSAAIFLNYWASLVRARSSPVNLSLIQPDFEAVVKAFPPKALDNSKGDGGNSVLGSRLANLKSTKVLCKRFIFSNVAIAKLKLMAATDHQLPNPTSFEAVTGFIWYHMLSAACTTAGVSCLDSGPTELSFTANIRAKITSPVIPKSSIGNLTKTVHSRVDTPREFPFLATSIHEAIYEMKQNLPGSLPEKGLPTMVSGYKFGSYKLTSWCKLGLSEIDFGFGKPNRVIPMGMVHPVMRNAIILNDYTDACGNAGIEATLILEEKEMQILESNPQFLSFALPN